MEGCHIKYLCSGGGTGEQLLPYVRIYSNFPLACMGRQLPYLEIFLQDAVSAPGKEGSDALYTRIYWNIDDDLGPGVEIFRDTHASWPRMRNGFKALIERYPYNRMIRNYYASFACGAGDRVTYLRIRPQLGSGQIDRSLWTHNYSPDVCDYLYMNRI
jgi:hypothetical protein